MVRFSSTLAKIPAITPWASSGNSTRQRTNGRNYRRILCRCIMAPRRASATSFMCLADSDYRTPAKLDGTRKTKPGRLPPMPTTRGALAAVAVGQKIYVNGGAGIPQGMQLPDGLVGGGPVDLYSTLEVFDTDTNTWTKLAPMPTPRNHHSIAYVDGKLYAIGGRVGSCYSGGWSSNVWMNEAYDIATNTWATRAPMPTARSGTGIAVLDGKIYVLGGEGWIDDFGGVFRTNEVYDPKTNSWSRATRMITPRHGFAVAQVGKAIYAVSGVNNAGGAGTLSVVNVNEIYEP